MEVGNVIFSAFYLSFTKELFPLLLGHHIARLVLTQMMKLSEKSLQKKKVSPPLINKSPPYGLQIIKSKYETCHNNFKAYLNILFCSQ